MSKRTLRNAVGAAAVVAVIGVGAVAVSAGADDGPSYRTTVAGTHEVDQVLDAVGTVEPVSQAAVAFPTSGTVASVDVAVGDQVSVGQALATLDTDDLTVSLHEAQAALDQAELLLARALDGEDVSASAAGAPGGGVGRSAGAAASGALADAQQAVLDAQAAVDEALATADAALASAVEVCGADAVATAADGSAEDTTTTTVADATADDAACQAALAASLEAQQALADAQAELVAASSALTDLLADLAADADGGSTTTTTTSTPTTTPSGSAPTGSGSSSSSSAPGGGSSSTTTAASSSPTAEELVAYQKDVDAAALDVAVAEQALAQAEIVSPIDGTVVSVGFEAGDDVEAASATQTIVVVGDGGFEVTTKVSVADLPDLEVGQSAVVRPDGSDLEIEGEVVRIAVAPDASSTSTYTVTIGLTGDTSTLGNGATASIEIVTKATGEALSVPTSAVTVDGDRSTVLVVGDGGEASEVEVEVGAVGRTWTEITEGVDDGDVVVLADLDEPLPGSATEATSSSSSSGAGGFPGSGSFPGGEPPSGGPPSGMGAPPGN